MTDIQIHPFALIIIGFSMQWMKRQKVSAESIAGECLAVVFWLATYPVVKWLLVKWLLVKCFGIEVIGFWVFFRGVMILMAGRVVEWFRVWGR